MEIGDQLPAFSLRNQNNELITSQDWIGSPVVIYFYPSDYTRICTAQACSFRNRFNDFESLDVRIIGISHNSVASHRKFATEYQLPFDILSDEKDEVRQLFAVPKGVFGLLSGRVTYIFDAKGKLIKHYQADFKAKEHIVKALDVVKTLI
ncbi:peroxiredoxin [Aureispira anguillae]|uniref:thioredoxin-dependent peroxiredoxin n=1 Tax=Aureispira anguillae TaxID=2864201 RepID=A0A916DTB5_9BACT|nr:peroxiredoxin [Aureispira anguillae]BDS11725.1 peroxiredoxin [Aureispira anguillae]